MEGLATLIQLSGNLISLIVWLLLAVIIGNKAKSLGQNFWIYFLLTFFGHIIGLVVSLVMINNQRNRLAIRNRFAMMNNNYNPYPNQYGQGMPQGQPYMQQPYGQQPYDGQSTQGFQGMPQGQPFQTQPQGIPQNFGQTQGQQFGGFGSVEQFNSANDPLNQPVRNDSFGAPPPIFLHVCKECGNSQPSGDYCNICGSKF